MGYRWIGYDSVWSNLVRRVLVEDGDDRAYLAAVDRLRDGGGWEVAKPMERPRRVHATLEGAERAAERAAGVDPSEVVR